MREIKFRVWDKSANRWFDKDEFRIDGNGEIWFSDHDRPQGWGDWGEEYELMQYTGLKGKNGKEIYEGDILGLAHKKYGLQNTKKIVWVDSHACFDWEDATGDSWPDGFTGFYDEYEVIGNIYENKDLLK